MNCIFQFKFFPHSAGIASSASSMSALALCLCEMENALLGAHTEGVQSDEFLRKASVIARLGSGSACRSVFPTMAAWGICSDIEGSNNEYAVGIEQNIHNDFKTYHDTILICESR